MHLCIPFFFFHTAKKIYEKHNTGNDSKLDSTCATCIGTLLQMAGQSITDEGIDLGGNQFTKEGRERLLCKPDTFTAETCWLDQTGVGDNDEGFSSHAALIGGGKGEGNKREPFFSAKEMNSESTKGESMVHIACKYARCCPQTEAELAEAFRTKHDDAEKAQQEENASYQAHKQEDKEVSQQLTRG